MTSILAHSEQPFVDAHCHIDLYDAPHSVIEQADNERIYTIAVTNVPSVFEHTAGLVAQSKYVRAAIGLHPELVHSHKHEIDAFPTYLAQTRYVGEIGLDYSTPDKDVRSAQRQILSTIADWVNDCGDKVLTVHSRRAARDVISILGGIKARVILHWFSGTTKELEQAISAGFFFSVNRAMLHSDRGRSLILQMPKEKVLTETDGPFLQDGKAAATPSSVKDTVRKLAEVWNLTASEVQLLTVKTLRTLLSS
jgi:TatD DNase family protein